VLPADAGIVSVDDHLIEPPAMRGISASP